MHEGDSDHRRFILGGLRRYPSFVRYSAAILMVGLATLVRLSLTPKLVGNAPFAFFYLAIFFSALLSGPGPGLVATFASLLAGSYFLLEPFHSFSVNQPEDRIWLLIFLLTG